MKRKVGARFGSSSKRENIHPASVQVLWQRRQPPPERGSKGSSVLGQEPGFSESQVLKGTAEKRARDVNIMTGHQLEGTKMWCWEELKDEVGNVGCDQWSPTGGRVQTRGSHVGLTLDRGLLRSSLK